MMPDSDNLLKLLQSIDLGSAGLTLLLVLGIWLLMMLIHRLAGGLATSIPSHRLSILKVQTLLIFGLYLGGGAAVALVLVRPSRNLAVAMGGSVAVMVALALKDVAASILSGLLLLFDQPFQVGDRVEFGEHYGDIVTIGLRVVRLRTLGDNIVTIPNSLFLSSAVSSGNYGALDMMVECDFHVSLEADLARASNLLYEVAVTSRYAYLKKPVVIAVSEVAVAERLAVRLRAKVYVLDTLYETALRSDITVRASRLFQENGILRPTD